MLLWLLFMVSVVWTMLFHFKRRNMDKLASSIPTTKETLPLVGITHKLIGSTETIMTSLKTFSYEAIEHEGIVKGWLGHILYLVVTDPVDAEMVLKTCLEKDDLHRFMRKVIGYGGIFAPVPIWRRRRKILLPTFSPKIVENFVEIFSKQSEMLVKHLNDRPNTKKFSVWPYLSTYTLDSVLETAMGVKINAQGNPDSVFLKSINRLLNLVCERIFHLWLQPDWLYRIFWHKYTEHQKCIKNLHSFTDDVIALKREEMKSEEESKREIDHENYLGSYKKRTFLDLLIILSGSGNGYTNVELREEVLTLTVAGTDTSATTIGLCYCTDLGSYKKRTFLDLLIILSGSDNGYTNVELREEVLTLTVAGTDTSATTIGCTLKLLGKYPQIQEKVYQELYDVFGDSDRPLLKDDLIKLKYMEKVVKETLRLFPPAPFVVRKVLEDVKLPSGRVLPAGSGIVVSIWGAHRDPKYWGPDVEHFDPDRFLPERFKLAHSCSYMPFSNGPRNCLGYQYALMSIKTALSAVLRRYKVVGDIETSPIPKIRVKLDILMKAVDEYEIALAKRQTTAL